MKIWETAVQFKAAVMKTNMELFLKGHQGQGTVLLIQMHPGLDRVLGEAHIVHAVKIRRKLAYFKSYFIFKRCIWEKIC